MMQILAQNATFSLTVYFGLLAMPTFKPKQVVAYFKDEDKPSWFLGRVIKYVSKTKLYHIVDLDDADDTSFVSEADMLSFPQTNARFTTGEAVMSLWYDAACDQWMTELYPAIILNVFSPEDSHRRFVALRFVGDTKVTYFPVERVIRIPNTHLARLAANEINAANQGAKAELNAAIPRCNVKVKEWGPQDVVDSIPEQFMGEIIVPRR